MTYSSDEHIVRQFVVGRTYRWMNSLLSHEFVILRTFTRPTPKNLLNLTKCLCWISNFWKFNIVIPWTNSSNLLNTLDYGSRSTECPNPLHDQVIHRVALKASHLPRGFRFWVLICYVILKKKFNSNKEQLLNQQKVHSSWQLIINKIKAASRSIVKVAF